MRLSTSSALKVEIPIYGIENVYGGSNKLPRRRDASIFRTSPSIAVQQVYWFSVAEKLGYR
jgi:hypothetical protein